VRGRAFLSEGLSNYSAMMVTEKALGPEQARRVTVHGQPDVLSNEWLAEEGNAALAMRSLGRTEQLVWLPMRTTGVSISPTS